MGHVVVYYVGVGRAERIRSIGSCDGGALWCGLCRESLFAETCHCVSAFMLRALYKLTVVVVDISMHTLCGKYAFDRFSIVGIL